MPQLREIVHKVEDSEEVTETEEEDSEVAIEVDSTEETVKLTFHKRIGT
jgi:hypothetical protein